MAQDPIWIAKSPLSELPEIKLHRDRWENHIVKNHVEMIGREENVFVAVSQPTAIVVGNQIQSHYVCVNHMDTASNGSPTVVIVHRFTGDVVTALFDRRYQNVNPEDVIWPKP